jgi:hypothetical protein
MSPTIEIAYRPALVAVPGNAGLTTLVGTAAEGPGLLMSKLLTLMSEQLQHQLRWHAWSRHNCSGSHTGHLHHGTRRPAVVIMR